MTLSRTQQNHLLASLADSSFDRLRSRLTPVSLSLHEVLEKPDEPITHVFFPISAISSVLAGAGEDRVAVGMIGREGMTGVSVVLGADRSPHECFIQVAGEALKIPAIEFVPALETDPALRTSVLLYARSFLLQTAQTALANGRSTIEQRLARWVLMCQDRLDSDEFPMTHEFLSLMLGVRRPGVTMALNKLEAEGMIRTARGRIANLDRAKLREIAGAIYDGHQKQTD